ncbi:MAG: DUF1254 domain-containing protein [Simkaniaceae bacterium]|nr:DUF1254 domain-containing protein [Simkaniaceae bacterium]
MFFKYVILCALFTLQIGMASSESDQDEWNYSLAIQAATWGSPLVTMYGLRYRDALGPNAKAKPNAIWKMEDVSSPALALESGYTAPNVNVIYGFGFIDLRNEPVILEVPNSNGRYYMVEMVDMWTNAFAYAGGVATGYEGGKFLLVGPAWKGEVPPGFVRIECPTPWILLQPRVHVYVEQKEDLEGAKAILNAIQVTPLSVYQGSGASKQAPYITDVPDPLQFWKILSLAMNENPPPQAELTALLPLFKPLGIVFGEVWDESKVSPSVRKAMALAAADIENMLSQLSCGTMYRGALIPPPTVGNFGTDYKTRAVMGRMDLTVNIPQESVVWLYLQDTKQEPLKGDRAYTLTFKEEPPFYQPGFWSITLYSREKGYPIPNPLNRYMIGSDSSQLKKNKDGSLTIYLQKENPGVDKESNWLPTPEGPFYLIGRVYAPDPKLIQLLSDTWGWQLPPILPKGTYP